MKLTERIATAEAGNVPYGAMFWASLGQTAGVLLNAYIARKFATSTQWAKWGNTIIGAGGAVLVPQCRKFLGESTAKSLAIGFGTQAGSPWMVKLLSAILYPTPSTAARREAQKRIGKRPNQPSNPGSLNGMAGARELNAMV